jgi:hypothetical protein
MLSFRHLWLALILLCSPALGQQSVVVPATTNSIPIVGAVGTSLLVQGLPNKRIYVTSVDIIPFPPAIVGFVQGTSPDCSTGSSFVHAASTYDTAQTFSRGGGRGAIWALNPGNSLCIIIQTNVAPGSLAYAQF